MKIKHLQLPLTQENVKQLHAGDAVLLSGNIVTGRDMAHKWLVEKKPLEVKEVLKNGAIYHCGPIMLKKKGKWTCLAAGPTTSIREEPYLADVMQEYGLRCVIGKGGMGERTAKALIKHNAVYLFAVGGAAVIYADTVESVEDVFQLNAFGVPEAMWVLKVKDFPAIISMDCHGNSLHRDVEEQSKIQLSELLK
ncbi:MAG: FumA C-terminus/TtdB family hydratase beta subunit [Candidatus Marinimicrobia bacterium]|nr:FumA C-terminus/TtdB family hydratase beta subunit [Candidatus Neomarinimicrobiota bacterium]